MEKKNKGDEYNSSLIDEIFDSISKSEEKKIRSKMLLAAKIEDAMIAKGWNKTKLLKETGQKNASVATKWFSGTHNFTFDTLFDIQEALEIDLLNVEEKSKEVVVKYHIMVQSSYTSPEENNDKRITRKRKSPALQSRISSFNTFTVFTKA